ncbi:FkbM family methyltransferase [Candidatus Dojkabacteria bacterium]|nr:FkbM family methyltransferase [Candidatus Dojkabacteria bacterium]
MINIETTKLRNYTVKYTNSKEYHLIKNEIFNSELYNVDLKEKKPVIVDCGSHIGLSILYFKSIYPNSVIYGFEPNPHAFALLEENVFVNNLEEVYVENVAVDTKKTEKELYIDKSDGWYSTGSYTKGSWKGSEETEAISVKTIDTKAMIKKLIEKHNRIDLLKVDIEGYEYKLLAHIQEALSEVENVIVEYHPVNNSNFPRILSILRKYYSDITYEQEGKEVTEPDLKGLFVIKATN